MVPSPKRIGLTLRVDHARERRDALDQAWYRVLEDVGLTPVLLPNRPTCPSGAAVLQEERLEGLILTGGNDLSHLPNAGLAAPERDALERSLLEAASRLGLPVLAVCRGMQHLVHHHGGSLRPVENHVARPHAVSATDEASPLIRADREVNSFHDWGLLPEDLPEDLRPAAIASDGTVEAVEHATLPQWGIMWHPEREPFDPRDAAILSARFTGEGEQS